MQKLTDKQQAFCQEYVKDFNATQAAIRAGYKPDYADRQGYNLIENNRVKQGIAKEKAKLQAKTDYDRTKAEQDYEQVRLLALDKGDLQAANTAIRGKNKLYALETDKVETKDSSQTEDLTEAEQKAYTEAARTLKIRLASA